MREFTARLFNPFFHASSEAEAGTVPPVIDAATQHTMIETRPQTYSLLVSPFQATIDEATRGVPTTPVSPELWATIEGILDPVAGEIAQAERTAVPAGTVIGETPMSGISTVSLAEFSRPATATERGSNPVLAGKHSGFRR